MSSPLGQYGPLAALVASLVIVVGWVIAVLTSLPAAAELQPLVILVLGVLLGGQAVTNGWKAPLTAVHDRVDALELQLNQRQIPVDTHATDGKA